MMCWNGFAIEALILRVPCVQKNSKSINKSLCSRLRNSPFNDAAMTVLLLRTFLLPWALAA